MPELPAPDAEPGPPELGTEPDVPVLLLPGVDVVPPALEPLPVVMPSSFRHFSRSVPTMPRHLLLVLPEAPLELLPVALGELLLGELLLPVAPVELLPDAPEELPELLSDEPLPVAPALLPALPPPMPPDGEPVLCANDTLDSAKSAAAVAALMSFNVMSVFLSYLLGAGVAPLGAGVAPLGAGVAPLLPAPELGCLAAPVPDAPPLGVLVLPVLPLVAPPEAAPEPDFLKCASHSSREICPSPFLSTDEKLGVCPLAPLDAPAFGALEAPPDALPSDDLPDALPSDDLPAALPSDDLPAALLSDDLPAALLSDDLPAALPEDAPAALSEGLLSVALGLDELGLCAAATLASAKSAAAVAVPTTLNTMGKFLLGELGRTAAQVMQ